MADQIGFEFTADDRKLLDSLHRVSSGLEEVRNDSKKMTVDVNKAFNQINRDLNQTQRTANSFRNTFAGVLAADAVRQGILLIKQGATEALRAAGNYEQLQVAFSTFIGSTDKANKLLEQLTRTAANTPFQQEEIFQGARQLLAYGVEADKINDQLLDLGNIASGVSQPLSRIVTVYGQIIAKGKLTGEELRQLREAGVNPIEELAQVLGVAGSEIEGLISKGKVTSEAVGQAFKIMTGEGGRFNDLMKKQSETFEGLQSNFSDSLSIILRQFADGLIPTLKEGLKAGIEFLQGLDPEKVKEFGASLGKIISDIASVAKQLFFMAAGFAAFKVIGSIIPLIKGVTSGVQALTVAIKANPIGLIAGTIVALLPQLTTLVARMRGVTAVMEEMSGVIKDLRSNFLDEIKAVDSNIQTLIDLNSTEKERQKALSELNQKYPEILAKYDQEKLRLEDIIQLQKDLKTSILERLKAERLDESRRQLQLDLEDAAKASAFAPLNSKSSQAEQTANLQANLRSKALQDFAERNAIIVKASEDLAAIDSEILQIQGDTAEQQKAIEEARKKELAISKELQGLTDKQLREILKSKDAEEIRKKLATEILKARTAEANRNAANKEDLEKAAKAMEKYRDAVAKAAQDLQKLKVEGEQDPFRKLASERDFALNQSLIMFNELREQAKEVGADITEIESLETQTRLAIDRDYYRQLRELQKEQREKNLAEFLEQSRIKAELNGQAVTGRIRSNGANTTEELTQVAILEASRTQLQVELTKTIETFGAFAVESLEAQRNYNQAVSDLEAAKQANRESALDRQEDLLLQEVDLIRRSGDSTLTLEEFKDKKRLEIQLEFARMRLDLLTAEGFGEGSIEVKQVKSVIAAYENALANLGKSTILDQLKDKLASVFKIDRDVLDESLQAFGTVFGNLNDLIADNTEFQIQNQERILDGIREQIQATEEAIRTEQEDKAKGYAANVDSKERELLDLRNREKQHQAELLKLQKSNLKQKLVTDSLSQISSLITMVSNVVAAESGKGLLGIATGLAAITGFLVMFKSYKNQARSLAQQQAFFKGGKIPAEGYTDMGGGRGHRVEGTGIIVGGGEMIVNRGTTQIHDDFLQDLNDGKYDHLDLNALLAGNKREPVRILPSSISRDLARKVSESNERSIQAKHRMESQTKVEAMRDVFSGEMTRLMAFMEDQPQYIPWGPEMVGYIIKRKNRTIRRKLAP